MGDMVVIYSYLCDEDNLNENYVDAKWIRYGEVDVFMQYDGIVNDKENV